MAWPSISDYQEAIQNPRVSLADPELQQGTPVCNRLGLPVPITGGFASVYQLRCGGGRSAATRTWAIRCFLRSFADQQKRYAAIDAHLRKSAFPYKVGFEFQPKGIRIRGEWYPILKMEWVPGSLLNERVEALVGDRAALGRLAEEWAALLRAMKKARIAHGDLQHGNILVVGGKLRLIDYDGMYVPALAGMGSHESGHPSYQHPARGPHDFGPEMDRFAALAIHVAILALACEPRLWAKFNNGDNLLFRRRDFQEPADSPVFEALHALSDPEVRSRAIRLQVAAVGPLAQVPEVDALKAVTAPARAAVAVGARAAGGASLWLPSAASGGGTRSVTAPGSASRLPEWVAEQLLTRGVPRGPAAPSVPFQARVLWRRVESKPPAAPRPGWLQWLPLPAAAEGGHTRPVNDVAFACQGSALVTGGDDGQAFLWAADTGRRLATLAPHEAKVAGVAAVGPSLVATAAWDQRIRIFSRWGVLKTVIPLEGSSRIYALAGSPDGARLAAGLGSKLVRVWDTASGAESTCLRGHTRKVLAVAFHPGGERLVSGSSDMSVRVWDARRGQCHLTLYGHTDEVTAVAVSPDGRWIASGGRDGAIFLWDARTGQPQLKIPAQVAAVTALVFLPDGSERLLAAGSDPIVRCWDLGRGQEAGRLEGAHSRAVRALALSPDGRRLATGGADARVIAWER